MILSAFWLAIQFERKFLVSVYSVKFVSNVIKWFQHALNFLDFVFCRVVYCFFCLVECISSAKCSAADPVVYGCSIYDWLHTQSGQPAQGNHPIKHWWHHVTAEQTVWNENILQTTHYTGNLYPDNFWNFSVPTQPYWKAVIKAQWRQWQHTT